MTEFEEIVDSIKNDEEGGLEFDVENFTKEEYMELAKHLKDAKAGHHFMLNSKVIGNEEAIEIARHLKDAKVSHKIDLDNTGVEDAGVIGMAEHLKDAKVSHKINLRNSKIGDGGAVGMASHLKDAKVSHEIVLSGNKIGKDGEKSLIILLKIAKNPPLISVLQEKISPNYAVDAFHNSKIFLETIADKIHGSNSDFKVLPILGIGTKLHQKLPELALQKISKYIGIKWIAMHNLATIRDVYCA